MAAGPEGYAALLQDPELAAVLLVLPPHVGPEVRGRTCMTPMHFCNFCSPVQLVPHALLRVHRGWRVCMAASSPR